MKGYDLLDAMGGIDAEYINAADGPIVRKRTGGMIGWIAVAACLCLTVGSVLYFTVFRQQKEPKIQVWDSSYSAENYFRYSGLGEGKHTSDGTSDSVLNYPESRYYSDERNMMEAENIIPLMTSHPLFEAMANFKEDGSFANIVLSWNRRDSEGVEHYSDLNVKAGYEEISLVSDCIFVEMDNDGNILEPAVTVTERDGVRIIARGREDQEKTITFQNENGWYQISGSWNDNYEDVVTLFEWFWNHPIDFSWFTIDTGDKYDYTVLNEIPDAFSGYLPDFAANGFVCETVTVNLKNEIPVEMEAYMVSGVTKDQAETGAYTVGENGVVQIQWCLKMEPDYYDLEWIGDNLENLTKEKVVGLKPVDNITTQTKIRFMQDGKAVTVYTTDVNKAWELIESIK